MDIEINQNEKLSIDYIKLQKMGFIYNALEDGWSIKKTDNCYIFKKKHSNEKEIYLDSYLRRFMIDNLDINQILNN